MMGIPPPLINCSVLTVWLVTRFLTKVKKPETGFCSSFQSEKELEGKTW